MSYRIKTHIFTIIAYSCVTILSVAYISENIPHPTFFGWDKVVHLVMYAILSAIAIGEPTYHLRHPLSQRQYITTALFCSIYGLCLELVQWPIPYRSFDWMDALANTIGSILGVFLAGILTVQIAERRKYKN